MALKLTPNNTPKYSPKDGSMANIAQLLSAAPKRSTQFSTGQEGQIRLLVLLLINLLLLLLLLLQSCLVCCQLIAPNKVVTP